MPEKSSRQWKWLAALTLLIVLAVGGMAWLWFAPSMREVGTDPSTWTASTRETIAEERAIAAECIRTGEMQRAAMILDKLLKAYPADAESHVLKAQILMYENKLPEAYDALTRALKLDGGEHDVHYTAGILAEKLKRFEKAEYHYKQASTLAPSNATYPLHLGQLLMKKGELDAAQMQVLKAQKLDSTLVQTYAVLAEISARRGKVAMAIDMATKAIDQVDSDDSRRVTYSLLKAQYLRRNNQPELALEMLRQLPPSRQMTPPVVRHLAASYLMMNQPEQAAKVWSELFTVDPHNAEAAAQAGLAWIRADERGKARQMLGLASRVDGNNPTVRALEDALATAQ